jgi:hypothetical protein
MGDSSVSFIFYRLARSPTDEEPARLTEPLMRDDCLGESDR